MADNKPDFDDCLEVIETKPVKKSDLSDFLGDNVNGDDWPVHWKKMPEFEQENKEPYRSIKVCFQTKEDFEKFKKLVGQSITRKTKTIWFPEFDREKNSLYSWIEEESDNDS